MFAQTINTDQLKNITETFEMKWRKQTDIQQTTSPCDSIYAT